MPNCLLCGSGVWYVGLFNADCTNSACTNYREPPPKPKQQALTYGTWAWAKKHQQGGWQLEWKHRGDRVWTRLTERLDEDPETAESEPYLYRLYQSWYECTSKHPHGSGAWALDQEAAGLKYHFNGDDYEIVP